MEKLKSLLKFVKPENVPGFLKGSGIAGAIAAVGYMASHLGDVIDVSDPIGSTATVAVGYLLAKGLDLLKAVK